MKRRKRSRAADLGYFVATMGLVCIPTILIAISLCAMMGMIVVPVQKLIVVFVILFLCVLRVACDKGHY